MIERKQERSEKEKQEGRKRKISAGQEEESLTNEEGVIK
jgi:hypothetical protein